MSRHSHRITQKYIHRLYTVGIRPKQREYLVAQLSLCELCSGFNHQYAQLEARLCRSGKEPTPFSLERVEQAVLEKTAFHEAKTTFFWPKKLVWLTAPATAVVVALILILVGPTAHRVPVPQDARLIPVLLTAKGVESSQTAEVGVRMFRVHSKGTAVEGRSVLELNDIVTFTYTNVSDRVRFLVLFGLQEEGTILWYYPGYKGKQSLPISSHRVDHPMDDGIRLSVNHSPGWLRVVAIFSSKPLGVVEIKDAVEKLKAQPVAIKKMTPLSLPGKEAREHSFLVEIHGFE